MNSRGQLGDMLVFFVFAFLMGVIGGGIVVGTLIYVGGGYDFRAGDASLLGITIQKCAANGFDLNSLKGKDDASLLIKNCELDKKTLESYYRIKICDASKVNNASECITSSDSIFSYGNVQPCAFTDLNKFLGCSNLPVDNYIVVTATNQQLRRNV